MEVRSQFLYEITNKVLKHNIPDELIVNVNQTLSKFVATDNVTMGKNIFLMVGLLIKEP